MTAPRAVLRQFIPVWIARLALLGAVRILDGGNRFNAYSVAHQVRMQTARLDEILNRIYAARAFTCYQVEALLASTAADAVPKLLLDPLVTFGDENVKPEERRRLLEGCIRQLNRLKTSAPVTVVVSLETIPDPDWIELLEEAASQSWRVEPEPPKPVLRLF